FFDISIAEQPAERLVFELRADVVPLTAANFAAICSNKRATEGLTFEGSPFHRIIPGFMAQGGDIT
ncbi:cyclophilin-like domain-containing protein, partial [Pavlovales sp. CCMP2436]